MTKWLEGDDMNEKVIEYQIKLSNELINSDFLCDPLQSPKTETLTKVNDEYLSPESNQNSSFLSLLKTKAFNLLKTKNNDEIIDTINSSKLVSNFQKNEFEKENDYIHVIGKTEFGCQEDILDLKY